MTIDGTPLGLLTALFRQRVKFVGVFLLFVLGGVNYLLFAPPLYQSNGSLLVKFGHNATPAVNRSIGQVELSQNDRREIVESDIGILQSHGLLAGVVNEFGVERIYP